MNSIRPVFLLLACMALLLPGCGNRQAEGPKASLVVAAHDTPVADKQGADYVCTSANDQDVINSALARLPESGGQVTLLPGNYVIRKTNLVHKGKPVSGGILINKSNVTLRGSGPSTRLKLADAQDCNVVRVTGVRDVLVENLSIDGNFEKQTNLERAFEACGIRAAWIHEADGDHCANITVRSCTVSNAAGLGIMLWGENVKALDNVLRDNQADDIELLAGPGEIRGNYITRTKGSVDSMAGTDVANGVLITGNTLIVKAGSVGVGIRSWEGFSSHVIQGNIIRVEKEGHLALAIDSRTRDTVISGNSVECQDQARCLVSILGASTVTGNYFKNVRLGLRISPVWGPGGPGKPLGPDQTRPVAFEGNLLEGSAFDRESFALHGVELTTGSAPSPAR